MKGIGKNNRLFHREMCCLTLGIVSAVAHIFNPNRNKTFAQLLQDHSALYSQTGVMTGDRQLIRIPYSYSCTKRSIITRNQSR